MENCKEKGNTTLLMILFILIIALSSFKMIQKKRDQIINLNLLYNQFVCARRIIYETRSLDKKIRQVDKIIVSDQIIKLVSLIIPAMAAVNKITTESALKALKRYQDLRFNIYRSKITFLSINHCRINIKPLLSSLYFTDEFKLSRNPIGTVKRREKPMEFSIQSNALSISISIKSTLQSLEIKSKENKWITKVLAF